MAAHAKHYDDAALLEAARKYSFSGRMDKAAVSGPFFERARGSIVIDTNGKEYLDFNSGQMCSALGHNHPRIVEAVKESCETMIHASSSIFNVKEIELAERLGQLVPRPLQKSTFLGSGSDSNEAAITIAKKYTGGYEYAAPHVNFSGLGAVARSVTFAGWHKGYGPTAVGAYAIMAPYCYRCPLGLTHPDCQLACLKGSLEVLDAQANGPIAAIITEPLFSAGGVVEPPKGWLAALAKACKERDILLILDEAQTGLGKLGTMFACEQEGVVPDLMTLSKHFGGGIEISAVVTTPEVEQKVVDKGLVMGHSHTNDPLACNAAITTLKILVEDNLPERAHQIGVYWKEHLTTLSQRYEQIGDVRGRGLIQGLEFVKNRERKEPFFELGKAVYEACFPTGLVFSVRRQGSVIRFVPPFSTTEAQLDQAAEILDKGITAALDKLVRMQ
jgi:2,2-dialkylglycine decarboxylase (pyruvate)